MTTQDYRPDGLYASCMEDIKWRVEIVERTLAKPVLDENLLDWEIVAVQFRKILEQIMLASLVANRDKYAEQHEKFYQHRKPRLIMKDIERINASFYPVPLVQSDFRSAGGIRKHTLEKKTGGYLTKDELLELYERSSAILHSPNPFNPGHYKINMRLHATEWLSRIKNLLGLHSIHLVDSDCIWVVTMSHATDGKAHVLTAQIVNGDE